MRHSSAGHVLDHVADDFADVAAAGPRATSDFEEPFAYSVFKRHGRLGPRRARAGGRGPGPFGDQAALRH